VQPGGAAPARFGVPLHRPALRPSITAAQTQP
jgi:hypothetical protein